ncbi:MAG: putative ubiquitin-RnfH superfamily antitoxin RatB of RatAB toxin-antitoxin module [Halieaceae bacterium]|jgi:putative ubiquitin-RnfH superfamily antitoxin RatB of RatAB toxin-antitoxin module
MSNAPDQPIHVEVVYAEPERQKIIALEVPRGSTALEAASLSGIEGMFPELSLDDSSKLGVFGHVVGASQVLSDGDRVEIYRPLKADPKEVRKARAARAKARREEASSVEG